MHGPEYGWVELGTNRDYPSPFKDYRNLQRLPRILHAQSERAGVKLGNSELSKTERGYVLALIRLEDKMRG